MKKGIASNSTTLNIEDGRYKVTVSSGSPGVQAGFTYIEVSTGSGMGGVFIVLLLLAALGYGVYWWVSNNKLDKNERQTRTKNQVKNSDSNTTSNQPANPGGSSDYF